MEVLKEGYLRELVNNNSSFLIPLSKFYGSRYKGDATAMSDALKEYVSSSKGSLDWQSGYVRRT